MLAHFATASATTTPGASDEISSSAKAGGAGWPAWPVDGAEAEAPLDNPQPVLERAAPLARDGARGGQAVAARAGDGPCGVAPAAHPQPGAAAGVLAEEARV